MLSYVEIISVKYPNLEVYCVGDDTVYENIIFPENEENIPSKSELDAFILSNSQDSMWNKIKTERDRRMNHSVYAGGYWFNSDSNSRIQQLALVMLGANMPPGISWKTMPNTFVTMTPTLALQIFQATALSDMTIFAIAEQKKAAMLLLNNPEVFDWQSGWPLIFGE